MTLTQALGWEVLTLCRPGLGVALLEPGSHSQKEQQLWGPCSVPASLARGEHSPPVAAFSRGSDTPIASFSPPTGPRWIPGRSWKPGRARRPGCQGKDLARYGLREQAGSLPSGVPALGGGGLCQLRLGTWVRGHPRLQNLAGRSRPHAQCSRAGHVGHSLPTSPSKLSETLKEARVTVHSTSYSLRPC